MTGTAERSAVVALVGPTAVGKSAVAERLASLWDAEIVSADSMQVYRGMDIGTAKPTPAERAEIPHHCLDLVEPSEEFSLTQFQSAVNEALTAIESRGGRALLVGGTGLYVRAVVDELRVPPRYSQIREQLETEADTVALHERLADLDPVAASRMEATNRRRIVRALEVCLGSGQPFSSFGPGLDSYPETRFRQFGLKLDRELIDRRIAERYRAQVAAGFVEEVRELAAAPAGLSPTARQALGYRELLSHVEDGVPLEVALDEAVRRTRRFARRQERWFRRDPRIVWLDATDNPMAALRLTLGDSTPCS